MEYRDRLKSLRIDNDLDQADVAVICGVSNKTVSHWETHRREIPVDIIIKLCKHYKVSANYVLGLPEYARPKNR